MSEAGLRWDQPPTPPLGLRDQRGVAPAGRRPRSPGRPPPAALRARRRRRPPSGRDPRRTPSCAAWADAAPAVRHRGATVAGRVEHLLPAVDVDARPRRRTPSAHATQLLHQRHEQQHGEAERRRRGHDDQGHLPARTGLGGGGGRADLLVPALRRLVELFPDELRRVGRRHRLRALLEHARAEVAIEVERPPGAVLELQLHPRGQVAVVDETTAARLRTCHHAARPRRAGKPRAP